MKNSSFRNTSESLSVKKELEMLVKMSKLEYKDSSIANKSLLRNDTKMLGHKVSQQLRLKGKEILGVVGNERRRSSAGRNVTPNVNAQSLKESKWKDVDGDLLDQNDQADEDISSLNVVMKGEGLAKSKKEKTKEKYDFDLQDETNIDKLLSELFHPDEQTPEKRPAILAAVNTTKSIALEPRKKVAKHKSPSRPINSRRKKDRMSERQSVGIDSMRSHSKHSLENGSLPSSPDLAVKKNLTTFDELDKEFYDIIKSKLNVDLKEKSKNEGESEESIKNQISDFKDVKDGVFLKPEEDEGVAKNQLDAQVNIEIVENENMDTLNEPQSSRKENEVNKIYNFVDETLQSNDASNLHGIKTSSDTIIDDTYPPEKAPTNMNKEPQITKMIAGKDTQDDVSEESFPTLKLPDDFLSTAKINENKDYENAINHDEAIEILQRNAAVSNEDIVNIAGSKASAESRPIIIPVNNAAFVSKDALHKVASQRKNSFLTSWTESKKTKMPTKSVGKPINIHHFCTTVPAIELPSNLKALSKYHHTRDKHSVLVAKKKFEETEDLHENQEAKVEEIQPQILTLISERNKPTDEEVRLTELASKILEDAMNPSREKNEKTFLKLQNVVNQVFNENDDDVMCLDGKKVDIKHDETRLYWTPAPPKFDLPPEMVKQHLIPDYHGAYVADEDGMENINEIEALSDDESSSDEDIKGNPSDRFRQRVINRGHGSALINNAKERQNVREQTIKEGEEMRPSDELESSTSVDETYNRASYSNQSVSEMRKMMAKIREDASKKKEEEKSQDTTYDFSSDAPKRRTKSEPLIMVNEDPDFRKFDSGFDVSFQELKHQLENVGQLKERILKEELENEESKLNKTVLPSTQIENVDGTGKIEDSVSDSYMTQVTFPVSGNGLGPLSSIDRYSSSRRDTKSSINSKLTVSYRNARRPYAKKAATKRRERDPERHRQIKEFLEQPSRKISRCRSYEELRTADSKERSSLKRATSLDNHINFYEKIGCHYVGQEAELFQWVKEEYWYQWFDEIYPPSVQTVEEERPPTAESEVKLSVTDEILQQIEIIPPPNRRESENDIYQLLRKEIYAITSAIEATDAKETLAFHLCRRGACYRKVGEVKNAWEDLERAIELEPKLLDAYWHRHLLYLLQENTKKALADLDFILKHYTTHAGAYRSRAEIYKKKGDLTSAIFNYSQAIKLSPKNADIYYERAYMFQERGDILLALEDFKEANNLLPSRTEGIRNIGIYHFDNRSWSAAINDFSALLIHEPYNFEAYTYRARAFAKLTQYENALKDLSLTIHLDPNSSIGFYYRGCLLRKCLPRQALQDLSTSILLDDTVKNVDAYLHRGILYNEMKRWEEAMADFEAALRLDSHIPAAHVNLGLIQMTRMNNPHMAIRRFNTAIKVDPTYVRAYICRAEASQIIKNIRAAVMDYTRAIHIRPDVTDYRMSRGKLLMEEGKFDLASYHIKQCAQMTTGAGGSPTQQQAVVQTFLKNYNQAIEILEKTVKSKPLPHLFILIGKTKMKAKMHKEAIDSFEKALQLMKPWDETQEWPLQAAEVHFLIGMVYTEMVNHSMALEAFNNTLKVNPEYAEAYYQRGMTKMKLRHAKAIQDFNRALAYNPKLFQAFLSRAAYYGMKGRYAKAIMNCNEVIRLQPQSIRGYLYRGALKYHIKAYQLAVKDLTEAVAIDHDCNIAYFNRAVCYQEMRYFQKALEDYGIVLLLEKKPNMKVLQNRGLLYLETGDIYNALQDFAAASKLEPRNPKLHHTLGICYQRLGQLDAAISCFSNALKTNAFFVDALLGRGNALMDYGTTEGNMQARRDYSRALHLDPMCLLARVNLAYSLQVQGRFKAAWMQFTKCIELDEGCKAAYEGRSVINLQMGNSFGAFVDINQALKIEETAEFLTNRGVINQFMGDNVNAMRDYQAALKKDPTYSLAYYNAANLYFSHRQFQQALEYYDRAIGWNRDDESAFVNRAITRVMMKNVNGAFEDFSKAIELSPYSAHIYFNRGNLNASLGSYEQAEKDYSYALSLQPGDALVYKRRADVRGKISKKEEALKDYKIAILIQTRKMKARLVKTDEHISIHRQSGLIPMLGQSR